MPTIHIINHTHWDREWFLTSIYTSQWIPGLIDRLDELAANNPRYQYFLDGQTLVVEDLLHVSPKHEPGIKKLVEDGNLSIGPYYCQPDWQLTSGEALIRNLLYGRQDMAQHGGSVTVGWLVDTFGHISQSPQLHRLFGIETVYVWRGVPQLEPYFHWQGADGERLFTVNLFGGYRNLYGVTHAPEVAVKRLHAEVRKLERFYPTPDIPLFDGYDLEGNPEDPLRFFEGQSNIPSALQLCESSPQDFALQIKAKLKEFPVISGELNSGKYGAIFPGTLSARPYLKVMKRDCEHLLYQVCEPLGVLARLKGKRYPAEQYEMWSRELLQNAVHDCICGVSVDQVHEKMEYTYRQVFDAARADIRDSLGCILHGFAPGTYAVSTNPFPYEGWHNVEDHLCRAQTNGIGVWQIGASVPIARGNEPIETFIWENDHYTAAVQEDGTIQVGAATLGSLVVASENGDTYSDEIGELLGICLPEKMVLEEKSDRHCVLRITYYALRIPYSVSWGEISVSATVRLTFDQSPLIRWTVDLDSRGTDFRVEMVFKTMHPGQVYAGMPFDTVKRPAVDHDLLPRQLDESLEKVLLGQREIGAVKTFPFQDFVAISTEQSSITILARGLHAYQADEAGKITIPLRRSVEWLTRPNLEYRVGDAGPFFYVPDARCERKVTHELAVMFNDFGVNNLQFHALNAGFQNPPLIVETSGSGTQAEWQFLQENLPMSSLHIANDRILARFFNPTTRPHSFSQAYMKTDVFGNPETIIEIIPPKEIVTLAINHPFPDIHQLLDDPMIPMNESLWRVGSNQGLPDSQIIQQLNDKIAQLKKRIAEIAIALDQTEGKTHYILQHQSYMLKRELYEYRLSVRLNELKLAVGGRLQYEYLYQPDEEVAAIGWKLNRLRI
ncbi:MAG: hypothetical protein ACE5GO_05035, partial [Anaerolineales bacterium]